MIVAGRGGSRALDSALDAIAAALGSLDDRDPDEMWVVGAPRARDWERVSGWDGSVSALIVPDGLYAPALARRARRAWCFEPDAERFPRAAVGEVPLPRVSVTGPVAPPALGTPLGDLWRRRLLGGRRLPESCGVTWIEGRGSAAVAAASAAWTRGRAVVALIGGGPQPRPLDRGAAILARSALEVDEATSFFAESPAVAQALAAEGRRLTAAMPSPEDVARALVQAAGLGASAGSL